MNLFHLSLRGTLLALLVLAVSCASPLANLVTGKAPSALPPLGPGETRLVFSTGGNLNESRAIATNGYMTIQLRSQADGTTKFATSTAGAATGGGATYTFTISGLVAGLWNMKVMLYDNQTNQNLLHYGSTQKTIVPGIDNPVSIDLYVPGTISGVSLAEAALVDHVTITATDLSTSKTLPMGIVWDLDAAGYILGSDTVPATQPAVTWSSSDEDIAWVSSSGRVTVVKPSTDSVTITAASVEDPTKTDTYTIVGVPAVYGDWKWSSPMGDFMVIRFTETGFQVFDGKADGSFDISKGTYTHFDGVLRMDFVDRLNLATRAWVSATGDMSGLYVFQPRVTPTSLDLMMPESPTSTPQPVGEVTVQNNVDNGPGLFSRIDNFVDSTGVTFTASSFSMVQGASIQDYVPIPVPANATIPMMVWSSSDPGFVGYGPNGNNGFRALNQTGTAVTIAAYSPTADWDSVPGSIATFTVNSVVQNQPPTITLNSAATQPAAAPLALAVGLDDEVGIGGVHYRLLIAGSNSNIHEDNIYPMGVLPLSASLYAPPLQVGTYLLEVTAFDFQGVFRTKTFPIYVGVPTDSTAPTYNDTYPILSGYPNETTSSSVQVLDAQTGIDPASIEVTVTAGLATGVTASLSSYSGGNVYINVNFGGVSGDASISILVRDYAGYPTTITKSVTVY